MGFEPMIFRFTIYCFKNQTKLSSPNFKIGMMELVDILDLGSNNIIIVRVQIPLPIVIPQSNFNEDRIWTYD